MIIAVLDQKFFVQLGDHCFLFNTEVYEQADVAYVWLVNYLSIWQCFLTDVVYDTEK